MIFLIILVRIIKVFQHTFLLGRIFGHSGVDAISGIRGVGSPFGPAVFGQESEEYVATANRNILVAVQIETVEGLANVDAISRVDGVGEFPTDS